MVGRAVVSGNAGSVGDYDDGQSVQTDVEVPLVDGAGQEGRVDRDDRVETGHRHAGRRSQGVLLGDADVEEPLREVVLEAQQARWSRHGGSDGNDLVVYLGGGDERLREG